MPLPYFERVPLTIQRGHMGGLATVLGQEIVECAERDTEECESYGYGPLITVDSDEARSHIEARRTMCYDILHQLRDAGDESARILLNPDDSYSLRRRVDEATKRILEAHAAERKADADRKAAETHARRVEGAKKAAQTRRENAFAHAEANAGRVA